MYAPEILPNIRSVDHPSRSFSFPLVNQHTGPAFINRRNVGSGAVLLGWIKSRFGAPVAELDIASLIMSDPMTVDAKLLPYMIREFSAQNYIQADYPEHVQRRILKNIWNLKSLEGYDAGVKLGLKILGMTAEIEQWHQQTPMVKAILTARIFGRRRG